MLETPIDVLKSILGYMSEGNISIIAKISECKVCCITDYKTYEHSLNGVDFNRLMTVFTLLDIQFKVH